MAKILIIDDEELIVELFGEYLSDTFEVDTCSDSLQAIEMIRNGNYEVVISDYNMPGIDGVSISELCTESKFILITGSEDVDDFINTPTINIALKKPVSPKILKNHINQLIEVPE